MKSLMSLFLTIILVSTLAAQPRVSLAEAWEIALQNNFGLQAQQTDIERAGREVALQKTAWLPTLSATAGYQHVSELAAIQFPFRLPGAPSELEVGSKDQYDLALQVRQLVFSGFRTRNLVNAARQQQQAGRQTRRAMENGLKLRVGLLFYELQSNRLRQEVLRQAIARAEDRLTRLRNLYHARQAAAFDTLEAANRKLELSTTLKELQNAYRVQLTRFGHLLNSEQPLDIIPDIDQHPQFNLPNVEELFAAAEAARPELQQLRRLQKAEQFRGKALQSAYYPQIAANASYHYARPGVDFFNDIWMDYYTLGVQLKWELWNWKRDVHKAAQSRLSEQRLSLQAQQMRQEIIQQVREAYELLRNARERIELRKQLLAQEKERYRITLAQYQQGLATNLDLRAAEKALTRAELNLQEALLEWNKERLRLDYALGSIGKTDLSSEN